MNAMCIAVALPAANAPLLSGMPTTISMSSTAALNDRELSFRIIYATSFAAGALVRRVVDDNVPAVLCAGLRQDFQNCCFTKIIDFADELP